MAENLSKQLPVNPLYPLFELMTREFNVTLLEQDMHEIIHLVTQLRPDNTWKKYPDERPAEYAKYEVFRLGCKKQHYETWNNTGWAYNNNDITHWRHIMSPLEPVKDRYTLADITKERQRAMDICWSFFQEYTKSFESRTQAEQSVYGATKHQSVAWVDKERAEVARYCANVISGRTALNLEEPLEELVLRTLKKQDHDG